MTAAYFFSDVEKAIRQKRSSIDIWFEQQWLSTPPPVYGSIDLRYAGFKVAPIDMNLYPAGFNNLSQASFIEAIEGIQSLMRQRYPNALSIMLIPENHSRNQFYWENINTLSFLLQEAGFDVRIGGDPSFFARNTTIQLPHGEHILVEPIQRQGKRLILDHYDPCLIWLNNDFSSGIPTYLNDIEQPICPPPELGWHSRLKTTHFSHYRDVAAEFSELLSIDPWLIDPLFLCCDNVDFMQREGELCLTTNVDALLNAIQKKYDTYNISSAPFVIVKADAGTYGMSVMSIKNSDDIRVLNRKQRTKMSASKGSKIVHRVIIQEGVYSIETRGKSKSVAEPVMYMMGSSVIGGFYRLHKNKSNSESLNAPGMEFEPLTNTSLPYTELYHTIAQLSMLAAAREEKWVQKNICL